MDDGAKSYRAAYLNTQAYDEVSQGRLIEALATQHSIHASLNRDKHYWRLRIAVGSMDRLRTVIQPYLLPMFAYKLPL